MSSHPALRSSARMRPAISYSTLFIEAPQKRSLAAATKLLFRSHQAIHFSENLAPDKYYLASLLTRSVARSALQARIPRDYLASLLTRSVARSALQARIPRDYLASLLTRSVARSALQARIPRYYLVRVALRLMGVAASALETGQFSLASCASFWKVSSSMPGTTASVSRSIGLMAKPPGT